MRIEKNVILFHVILVFLRLYVFIRNSDVSNFNNFAALEFNIVVINQKTNNRPSRLNFNYCFFIYLNFLGIFFLFKTIWYQFGKILIFFCRMQPLGC